MRTTLPFSAMLTVIAALFDPITARAQATETNRPHHLQYEPAIRAFEAHDQTNPPPKDAVLFIGSSSIRLWTNAPAQFPEFPILNRGFGGSHLSDVAVFASRIAIPYRPKAIVLYAGENDLASGKTPGEVLTAFQDFLTQIHKAHPQTPVIFISLKPSPSREKFLPQFREANRLIHEVIRQDARLTYVDVFAPMLDANGKPREELFVRDRLHLNTEGYKLWAGIVKPVLDKVAASR